MNRIKTIYRGILIAGIVGGSIAEAAPVKDEKFFDGKTLKGWSAPEMKHWSVKDGAIIGQNLEKAPRNYFLWSDVEVEDFYLSLDVRLTPANRNAGIQFRSKSIDEHGQAYGYQADAAAGFWGTLYHEHGRKAIDWSYRGKKLAKANDWNRYEILAIGHYIWIALNGKITSAVYDPQGETKGKIALQIHSGPPLKVEYKILELIHNPEMKLANKTEVELRTSLKKKVVESLQPILPSVKSKGRGKAKRVFTLSQGDTVAILGGANAYKAQTYGWIESYLSNAYPDVMVKHRNMAWSADTIFKQQRPRNFFASSKPNYGERDGRSQLMVDKLFLWFGKSESLEGRGSLSKFKENYAEFVDQAVGLVDEVILVIPTPHGDPLQLGLKVKERNDNLRLYADAIREIAKEKNIRVVDLFSVLETKSVTSDGILLSPKGQQIVAREMIKQLSGRTIKLSSLDEKLRKEIITKNWMWQNYWVPTNWAFLYGNRQSTPSSRLHTDRRIRWFPGEVQQWLVATEKKEQEVFKQRQ